MNPTRPSRDRPSRRAAFTLVELLVVVAVVALLLGILLPALGQARELARRSVCLSNLRQVHVAYFAYADLNEDRAPIGYRKGTKQWNSMIYSGWPRSYVLFGLLRRAGLMDEPDAYFCPSERDPQFQFDTESNPWPPGPEGASSDNVYAGYASRPAVDIPDDLDTPGFSLPKLSAFGNDAIAADLTSSPPRLDNRHVEGVNVLGATGSAYWVSRARFDDPLSVCREPQGGADPTFNPQQQRIWESLDR